jgi:2-oxoisovalerate dehydrogenase E1 component beta subunit
MSDVIDTVTEAGTERRLNMIEAINEALDIMLGRDPDVIIMGEDVGYFGGVFRATVPDGVSMLDGHARG